MLLYARCPVCEEPVSGWCRPCWRAVEPAPPGLAVPAAVMFDGVGRRLLLGLKYANVRGVGRPLALRLAAIIDADDFDVITWAPTSRRRARRRGYDQAEVIARALAEELRMPCRPLLRRVDRAGPQTGRSLIDRQHGPQFVARRLRSGERVLVVDDVVTTGATLKAAERALRRAGAATTFAVAAATTPRPGSASTASPRVRVAAPSGSAPK